MEHLIQALHADAQRPGASENAEVRIYMSSCANAWVRTFNINILCFTQLQDAIASAKRWGQATGAEWPCDVASRPAPEDTTCFVAAPVTSEGEKEPVDLMGSLLSAGSRYAAKHTYAVREQPACT